MQLFAVAATLKSVDYNVAMTFILNNNNTTNNNNELINRRKCKLENVRNQRGRE